MKHVEHQHQKALIDWAMRTPLPRSADVFDGARISDYLLAIPNGGKRNPREAARLKAEGVKAGVSDLLLPLRRLTYSGMWLEMKAPGERPTTSQQIWLDRMGQAGYFATWADDWIDAAAAIAEYCGIAPPVRR